jgi:hypothetical protein
MSDSLLTSTLIRFYFAGVNDTDSFRHGGVNDASRYASEAMMPMFWLTPALFQRGHSAC